MNGDVERIGTSIITVIVLALCGFGIADRQLTWLAAYWIAAAIVIGLCLALTSGRGLSRASTRQR